MMINRRLASNHLCRKVMAAPTTMELRKQTSTPITQAVPSQAVPSPKDLQNQTSNPITREMTIPPTTKEFRRSEGDK
jgi:hypothetical protein